MYRRELRSSVATRCRWLSLSRRAFYSGLDDSRIMRLRRSSIVFNKPRGRDSLSLWFEKRVRILPFTSVSDLYEFPSASGVAENTYKSTARSPRVLVVELLLLEDVETAVQYPASNPMYYAEWPEVPHDVEEKDYEVHPGAQSSLVDTATGGYALAFNNRRHLQQFGDTTLLYGSFVRYGADNVSARFSTALCINPFLSVDRFRREEAQVEMISAYRNILCEATEVPGGPANIIRIPALCCDTCGPRFHHEIGKLNQQALIKGFHRLGTGAKELLALNPQLSVELFVPIPLLQQFETAFLEEAWETPESTINPGRTALYPGLAPPRSLLPLEGWTGRRQELVDAIESGGRSLMSGTKRALDGTPISDREVLAELRLFGREKEEKAMLERERATAVQQGYETEGDRSVPPLRPGINQLR
uniref:Uncharacterized protein TCIL3000_2_780 n=1 Tax=Trypanosoma congolense (strain IL3000) TaxID=1068625 RepID=G0UJE9_TRYCI|nr:unnamed protein product [Trypanosoma congolense IL3000]